MKTTPKHRELTKEIKDPKLISVTVILVTKTVRSDKKKKQKSSTNFPMKISKKIALSFGSAKSTLYDLEIIPPCSVGKSYVTCK